MNKQLTFIKQRKPSVDELMKKQLNLYPYKNGRLSDLQKRKRLYLTIGGTLTALLLSFSAYIYFQNNVMLSEIASRTANLEVERERLYNQQMLDELMKRIDYKSTLLDYVDKKNTSATLVIEMIERNIPADIQYINLDFISDSAIRISCRTNDQEWIAKLVHQLKNENFFDDVFVESIAMDKMQLAATKKTEYEFQLICSFGGDKNETQK